MTRGAKQRSTTCRFIARAGAFFCAFVFAVTLDSQEQKPRHTQHGPESGESTTGGREIFESRCAACHGLDGRGGERGPNILTRPEALSRSDNELLKLLQDGLRDSGMPPFESLGAARLKAVVAYLRA